MEFSSRHVTGAVHTMLAKACLSSLFDQAYEAWSAAMAFIRSIAIPYLLLHVVHGQDATTSLSSESEQLFWTRGIPDPETVSESTTPLSLRSTSEPLFWTQALSDPHPDVDLTATVTLASHTPASLLPTTSPQPLEPCNLTALTCPACDTQPYTSPANTTYTLACAAKLYSSAPYAVQRWLTPLACVAECDKYDWCKGATSWAEGNCQLARGEDVFTQYLGGDGGGREEGAYVAFLRVPEGYVPEPPATVPSAFPTGPVPLPSPISPAPRPSPKPGKCDLRDISCPASRGETITSPTSNNTYSIRCNFESRCDEFRSVSVRGGRQNKCSCVAHCDQEEGCVAAVWDRGSCGLCFGGLEGLRRYMSPRGYVVFVREGVESSTATGPGAPPTLQPTSLVWATQSARTVTSSRQSSSTVAAGSRRSESRSSSSISQRRTSSASRSSSSSTRRPTITTSARRTSSTSSRSPTATTTTNRSPTSRASRTSTGTSTTLSSNLTSRTQRPNSPSTGLSTQIPLTTPPSPSPANLPPLASALCPADDDAYFHSPGTSRTYILQCGVRFDAASTRILPFSLSFAVCAEQCKGECGGVVFNPPSFLSDNDDDGGGAGVEGDGGGEAMDSGEGKGGHCTLYTSISAIQPMEGATAGVWVRFPGTGVPGTITRTFESTATSSSAAVDLETEIETTGTGTATTATTTQGKIASARSMAREWETVVPTPAAVRLGEEDN